MSLRRVVQLMTGQMVLSRQVGGQVHAWVGSIGSLDACPALLAAPVLHSQRNGRGLKIQRIGECHSLRPGVKPDRVSGPY